MVGGGCVDSGFSVLLCAKPKASFLAYAKAEQFSNISALKL